MRMLFSQLLVYRTLLTYRRNYFVRGKDQNALMRDYFRQLAYWPID